MSQVDVSVVLATRNRSDLVADSLASIARQTHQNYEVFVVDDGSTADHAQAYRALIERLGPRFHLLQPLQPGQTGSGPAVSRNRGLFAGTGRYVAFLDDDDTWTWDDNLRTAVEMLDKEGTDLYCADMQGFQGDTVVWDTWFPERQALLAGQRLHTDPAIYRCSRAVFMEAAGPRALHVNTIVVRRALVDRVGGLLPWLRFSEDYEFILRLIDGVDTVLFCDKAVVRYRFPTGDSVSLTQNRPQQHLQSLTAAQHLRLVARSPEGRRAARKLQAWTLRLLSQCEHADGHRGAAASYALEAFVAYPTAGALLQLAKTALPSGAPPA